MIGSDYGVVVERQGRRVTVLTPQGEWRTIVLQKGQLPQVGEEIMLPPPPKRIPRSLAGVAVIIIALLLSLPLARQVLNPVAVTEPLYYINVDINPSLELSVNNRDRVIAARGLNSEGENLLEAIALEGEKATTAVEILASEAVRLGYFLPEQEGTMLLTVTPATNFAQDDLAEADKLGNKLSQAAQDIFQQAQVEAVVQAAAVQPQIREHAIEAGLSAGKYSLLLEALAAGVEVSAADLQRESATRVLARHKADWQQLWQKVQKEKDLLKKEEQLREKLQKAVTNSSAPQGNAYGHAKGNAGKASPVTEPGEQQDKANASPSTDARSKAGPAKLPHEGAAVRNNSNGKGNQPANNNAIAAARKETRSGPANTGDEKRPERGKAKVENNDKANGWLSKKWTGSSKDKNYTGKK